MSAPQRQEDRTSGTVAAALVLVTAKAPVAGEAKTRLAATVGPEAAADLAAAALLDTLAAAEEAVGADRCVLALAGDLRRGSRAAELRGAAERWHVIGQRGDTFAERLAHAHHDAGPGPRVQVGMDTPQLDAATLLTTAALLESDDALLGPAVDGGWWVLGLREPAPARALRHVPMSTSRTCDDTRAALAALGLRVGSTALLRDVDTAADAAAVAAAAPGTRFGRAWARLEEGVRA